MIGFYTTYINSDRLRSVFAGIQHTTVRPHFHIASGVLKPRSRQRRESVRRAQDDVTGAD